MKIVNRKERITIRWDWDGKDFWRDWTQYGEPVFHHRELDTPEKAGEEIKVLLTQGWELSY